MFRLFTRRAIAVEWCIAALLLVTFCAYTAVAEPATGSIKGVVRATTQTSGTRPILLSNARITLVNRDLSTEVMVAVTDDAGAEGRRRRPKA